MSPPRRSAHVVVELVDMAPTYAVWQVEDDEGLVLDESELVAADLVAGDLDSLIEQARTAWKSMAASAGMDVGVGVADRLSVRLSITTFETGTCGELRVFAMVQ